MVKDDPDFEKRINAPLLRGIKKEQILSKAVSEIEKALNEALQEREHEDRLAEREDDEQLALVMELSLRFE